MKKQIVGGLLAALLAAPSMAQVSSTLSPYSQFGLGTLSEQSQGFSRGMGGLGIGIRDGKQVNSLNPASYSAIDSLTMIFDVGLSAQKTNFKEGGLKVNANTADVDYAVAIFRLLPKVGFSFGILPFSNVGYKYSRVDYIGTTVYANEQHLGSGGFNQAYIGAGWEVAKGLSIGANIAYLWGNYERSVVLTPANSYANTLTKTYAASVRSYKLDFGAQWQHRLDKDHLLTVGATLGIGHKLNADAELTTTSTNTQTSVSWPSTQTVENALSLPTSFGLGASVLHKNTLTVGVDYSLQQWGKLSFPAVSGNAYLLQSGLLKDRHKVALGADWIPNPYGRNLLQRVHYRLGASYATPYIKIQGADGPKELSIGGGFGIPLVNNWNNRSMLNISAQWVRSSSSSYITENTFRINLGLTFNERWFAKWKVD